MATSKTSLAESREEALAIGRVLTPEDDPFKKSEIESENTPTPRPSSRMSKLERRKTRGLRIKTSNGEYSKRTSGSSSSGHVHTNSGDTITPLSRMLDLGDPSVEYEEEDVPMETSDITAGPFSAYQHHPYSYSAQTYTQDYPLSTTSPIIQSPSLPTTTSTSHLLTRSRKHPPSPLRPTPLSAHGSRGTSPMKHTFATLPPSPGPPPLDELPSVPYVPTPLAVSYHPSNRSSSSSSPATNPCSSPGLKRGHSIPFPTLPPVAASSSWKRRVRKERSVSSLRSFETGVCVSPLSKALVGTSGGSSRPPSPFPLAAASSSSHTTPIRYSPSASPSSPSQDSAYLEQVLSAPCSTEDEDDDPSSYCLQVESNLPAYGGGGWVRGPRFGFGGAASTTRTMSNASVEDDDIMGRTVVLQTRWPIPPQGFGPPMPPSCLADVNVRQDELFVAGFSRGEVRSLSCASVP